jgi:hypothetical protein
MHGNDRIFADYGKAQTFLERIVRTGYPTRPAMVNAIRWILTVWFAIIATLVTVPSAAVLWHARRASKPGLTMPPAPPEAPPLLSLTPFDPKLPATALEQQTKISANQVAGYSKSVEAYKEQVNAYTQQLNAYKSFADYNAKDALATAYELVVKNTVVTLVNGLVTALIGYVFAKAGASLVDNYLRSKNNQALQPISYW